MDVTHKTPSYVCKMSLCVYAKYMFRIKYVVIFERDRNALNHLTTLTGYNTGMASYRYQCTVIFRLKLYVHSVIVRE